MHLLSASARPLIDVPKFPCSPRKKGLFNQGTEANTISKGSPVSDICRNSLLRCYCSPNQSCERRHHAGPSSTTHALFCCIRCASP